MTNVFGTETVMIKGGGSGSAAASAAEFRVPVSAIGRMAVSYHSTPGGARLPSGNTSVPGLAAASTTTPTLTLNTSMPYTTSFTSNLGGNPSVFGVPNTNYYTFLGGANYVQPSAIFPGYVNMALQPLPNNTLGFSGFIVEFECDDPGIAFYYPRNTGGSCRVVCDGAELFRINGGLATGTAQGGSANTITLAASSIGTNSYFNGYWVHITSGTGAGQYGQILSYVGSTKVATMVANWTTAPDATSVYEVTDTKCLWTNLTNTSVATYIPTITWSGERRFRHYRIECGGSAFGGISTSTATSTVRPARRGYLMPMVWIGDSYGAGTGSGSGSETMSSICSSALACELINLSMGGTGMLATNGGVTKSYSAPQRILPPVNAWFLNLSNGYSGGYITIAQGGKSVQFVPLSDNYTTMQAKFDAAFGVNAFSVVYGSAAQQANMWLIGTGANANVTTPMTIDYSQATITSGSVPTCTQYLGDLWNNLAPAYRNGNLPFRIVLAMGHNDTQSSNSAFTPAMNTLVTTQFLTGLATKYPNAFITVVGNMYLPGGSIDPNAILNNNALKLAVQNANILTPSGNLSFIDTLTNSWATGTGFMGGGQTGTGNGDFVGYVDNVHPSTYGHNMYGLGIARAIQTIEAF